MTIGLLFWILYIVALVIGGFWRGRDWVYNSVLFFVLIGLLGWAQFGAPVK